MFSLDPTFGNPTMSFSQNLMAASTNYFLDDRVELDLVKEFVDNGTKYIALLTSQPTPTEKINETIAIVQGANRAHMLRSILRNYLFEVNTFAQGPQAAPQAAEDTPPATKN